VKRTRENVPGWGENGVGSKAITKIGTSQVKAEGKKIEDRGKKEEDETRDGKCDRSEKQEVTRRKLPKKTARKNAKKRSHL